MNQIRHHLLLLACCTAACAQTNTESADPGTVPDHVDKASPPAEVASEALPEAAVPESAATHIYSDAVELGIKSRSAVYRGNVRLDDPRIQLTCEQLSAEVPEEGGRVDRVVAETNVVILLFDQEGRTNRAYADRAVYTYVVSGAVTNEMVELSGDPQPRIERPEGTLYGDVIVWDRVSNQIRATNQRMIYRADSRALTNLVPQAKAEATPLERSPAEVVAPDETPPAAAGPMTDE